MKRILIVLLIFISFAIPLSAGPFGIEFGWSIEDMHEAGVEFIYPTYEEALAEEQWQKENGHDGFMFSSMDILPPKPSEIFPFYSVKYSPELGLYEIEAYEGSFVVYTEFTSTVGNNDNYAISKLAAIEKFNRAYNALLLKYGRDSGYGNRFSSDTHKSWDHKDNEEHMDIDLSYLESYSYKDFDEWFESHTPGELPSNHKTGKFYISLTYSQEEYLQALNDAEVL